MEKVLIVIGDGGEVIDTMVPYYRLGEDYEVVVAAPEKRLYHLVQHELAPGWDITRESPGYHLQSDIAFRDVDPGDYIALVLPGGRAPEYLRYDPGLKLWVGCHWLGGVEFPTYSGCLLHFKFMSDFSERFSLTQARGSRNWALENQLYARTFERAPGLTLYADEHSAHFDGSQQLEALGVLSAMK